MAAADDAVDLVKKARRIQELFRGRFSEGEALLLIRHQNGDVTAAVDFIMTSSPEDVRQFLHKHDEAFIEELQTNSVIQEEIPFSVRQFACEPCDRSWWRKVPSRKEVSKCHRCKQKYDALPREREWGWAEFYCSCGNVFNGFAQMGVPSLCYQCSETCLPVKILPPTKRARPRSNHTHSCFASNCFNRRTPGIGRSAYTLHGELRCCHPRSISNSGKRVLFPSQQHHSTGSTVATFLTQDDLISETGSFVSTLPDINEEDGDANATDDGGDGDDDDDNGSDDDDDE